MALVERQVQQTQTIVENGEQIFSLGKQMSDNIPTYFLLAFTLLLVVILYAFKTVWDRMTKLLDGVMSDIKKVADTNEKLSLYIVKDMASIKEKVTGLASSVNSVNHALMSNLDLNKRGDKK